MLVPSIFGGSLFDDFMDDFAFPYPYAPAKKGPEKAAPYLMRTDVRETDNGYEVEMDLPGVKKEDVTAELKDGYLTVTASADNKTEEKGENGRYIRRERYCGSASRSFFVGEEITQDDIKAKFENGVLKITVPKKEAKPEVEKKTYVTIEG